MTLQQANPAEEIRRAHRAALTAVQRAVTRNCGLWRSIGDPDARVPGLAWTAGETAAHVVGDLRENTEALSGRAPHVNTASASPSRISAAVNAQQLTEVRERDMGRLADLLDDAATRYLSVATAIAEDSVVTIPNGLVTTAPTMTSLLLGEQLIHGLDIARAARRPWSISRDEALLVIPGVLSLAPHYVHPARSAGVHVSFELRMRGGGRYRFAVHDGAAHIGAAGEKADCVISADPAAFLLLGYGRIPPWAPVIRGKLLASGRKPWLAPKFATLLTRP